MSEEYRSIFQTPKQEQVPAMEDWLDKHVGTMNESWKVKSPELLCAQITFKHHKHKRMFDFYAELQGITVYDTLTEYQIVEMRKLRSKVNWMDDTN